MDREKALLRFKERTAGRRQEYREQMGRRLLDGGEYLEKAVKGAIDCLGEEMGRQGKEYVSFLYLSLLRTDVLSHNYRFLLQAMDLNWYLDEEPVQVYFDTGDLYAPLEELWADLTEESHSYMGAVNPYDIQGLIFDELKAIDGTIAGILRYRLRDWQGKEIFAKVPLTPQWLLKWGEYRDQTEFLLQTEQIHKGQEAWEAELKKAARKPEAMIFSYWYQGSYEGNRLEGLDMRFTVFEGCRLQSLGFTRINLEGARFTGSSLYDCHFEDCSLLGADFTGCSIEGASFVGTDLSGALFPAKSVPFLKLDPEQLQAILIEREEEG